MLIIDIFDFPEMVQEEDSVFTNPKGLENIDISASTDPESFLAYLDNHFIPEVQLEEDQKVQKINFKTETKKDTAKESSSKEICQVKLNYKGQKNDYCKGTFAERVDVVYKTLLRSVKRYLWDLFLSQFDIKTITDKPKSSKIFRQMLEEFY